MKYNVATAPSRTSKHWKNETLTWDDLVNWVKDPVLSETKETGNYILATLDRTTTVHKKGGAPCTNIHRDNKSVRQRSPILAMDVDHPQEGFEAALELQLQGVRHIWHTTYSSTPDEPRYRLLVAVDRPMAPVEYSEATEALAARIDRASFDDGTFEPARFMFRPGIPDLHSYDYHIEDGRELSVDTLLDEYAALVLDGSLVRTPKVHKNKRDPFSLPDPAGAFNRAYEDLDLLIEEYELPYDKESDDRYRLAGASSEAGFGPIKDAAGLFYSNHAGDPAYGQACSAFDLVRLHRFKDLDDAAAPNTPVNRLPSHAAMCELASEDRRVTEEIFNAITEDFDGDDEEDEPDWRAGLRISPRTGNMINNINNWLLIRDNDPLFRRVRLNDMTKSPEWIEGSLPWGRQVEGKHRDIEETEFTEVLHHVQKVYKIQDGATKQHVTDLLLTAASRRRYHPIRDYLNQLRWDGTPRLETCLPGVKPNNYTRWVARKCLIAAVARVFQPGVKWDHSLVLHGGEGLGKSMWIHAMARGHDGKLPTKIDSTDAVRMVHRNWIVVGDEGHALRKSDFEFVKEFLTRTKDEWRNPYDRLIQQYPRMSVIWFTTNDGTFLRNEAGNRRFLVVHCADKADWSTFEPEYVDQIWAEAMDLYMSGIEQLWLTQEEEDIAASIRAQYTEEDLVRGYVSEYVSRLVPEDWSDMVRHQRVSWMTNRADGFEEPPGTVPMQRVCAAEILEITKGKNSVHVDRLETNRVTNALKQMEDWTIEGVSDDSGGYGPQLMFIRKDSLL